MSENEKSRAGSGEGELRRRKRRHSSSRWPHHSHHKRKLPVTLIATLLGVGSVILVIYGVNVLSTYHQRANAMRDALIQKDEEIGRLRTEVDALQKKTKALTEQRLPHLRMLEFDKVMPIHDGYIRNVVFTRIRQDRRQQYEYKLVMENNSRSNVLPDVRVLVFDATGVQIGGAAFTDANGLSFGESRSRSALIEFFMDETPVYFHILAKQ